MGQIRVDAADFSLKSTYSCSKTMNTTLGTVSSTTKGAATTVSNIVKFSYSLPEGASVTAAKIYATLGSPLNGAELSTINGVSVGTDKTASVDVTLTDGETSVSVPFRFKCRSVYHDHGSEYHSAYQYTEGDYVKLRLTYNHTSALAYSDVYLQIDYEDGDESGGDDTGDSGSSGEDTSGAVTGGVQTVEADSFSLVSKFNCITRLQEKYLDSGPDFVARESVYSYSTDATRVSQVVTFSWETPAGATIKSARIVADVGSPKYAADILTINGVSVDNGTGVSVPVTLPDSSNSIDVPFVFRTMTVTHDHTDDGTCTEDTWSYPYGNYEYSRRTRWFEYSHSSAVSFDNVQLIIEYEAQGAQGWELDKWEVEAADTVTLSLTDGADSYERIVQVSIGGAVSEYSMPLDTAEMSITVPVDWLEEMPNATSGVALVTVTAYDVVTGKQVAQSSDNLTIICPVWVVPTMTPVLERLLTVDGVTYPDVTGGYVQSKSAFEARIDNASGAYGSYITSQTIEALGRMSYDGTLASGWLDTSGAVSVRYTVTDSRGRTTSTTQTIIVEPYAPPSGTLTAYRVNADGAADMYGDRIAYSYTATHTDLSGKNTLTATLTADGVTATDPPGSGLLFPAGVHTFDPWAMYPVDLVLTDAYGSVAYTAIVESASMTTVVIEPPRKLQKRRVIFGDYDTAEQGKWTLSGLSFAEPTQQTSYVDVLGRAKGPLDLSTSLTDGVPTYGSRTLTVELEGSEDGRLARDARISEMLNQLDGYRMRIILPDDPDRYIVGRVTVRKKYSDLAHAAVTVTAVCEPWRYNARETCIALQATGAQRETLLPNTGRKVLIPAVAVTGGDVKLTCNGLTWELSAGDYTLPALKLAPGYTPITYSGTGLLTITYREAIL